MAWPDVTPSDVENLWRPLTDDEANVAAARIAIVEAELRSELRLHGFTGTPVAGTAGWETPEQVAEWGTLYAGIVADVVRESLRNPDGWAEETERIDDFVQTRRRDPDASNGVASVISADGVARLLPKFRRRRGAFSIRLGQT